MKLIKEGKRKAQVFAGRCDNCGSEFEAQRSELTIESCEDPRDHDVTESAKKSCPVCTDRRETGTVRLYAKQESQYAR